MGLLSLLGIKSSTKNYQVNIQEIHSQKAEKKPHKKGFSLFAFLRRKIGHCDLKATMTKTGKYQLTSTPLPEQKNTTDFSIFCVANNSTLFKSKRKEDTKNEALILDGPKIKRGKPVKGDSAALQARNNIVQQQPRKIGNSTFHDGVAIMPKNYTVKQDSHTQQAESKGIKLKRGKPVKGDSAALKAQQKIAQSAQEKPSISFETRRQEEEKTPSKGITRLKPSKPFVIDIKGLISTQKQGGTKEKS